MDIIFSLTEYIWWRILSYITAKYTHTHTYTHAHLYLQKIILIKNLWVCFMSELLQSCPTLHDPIDGSPPGSPIPGILQARTLEWVAISFSSACKWKVKVKSLSRVWLLATPWTAAHQAPPSMGFSRQEYWSGVPLPSPLYCLASPTCRSSHVWIGGRQGLSNFTH